MTCENCLYNKNCQFLLKHKTADEVDGCTAFEDRSEWVHLPCKVSDFVYRTNLASKGVEMLKVEGFLCNLVSWKVHCIPIVPTWIGNQKEHVYISFSSFGKTVFLTQEEAKRALEERINKND